MTQIPESPFVLVDGSSYLFRAYYALPPLTNSAGQPTGAIYGVINMLKKLISTYNPEHIAVVFDTKGKTFRHEQYEEYKANRAVMPDELAEQIEPLHNIIRAMGLPLLAVAGVEADDVIGTLARQAEQQGVFTLISTGDKDMAQLVDKNTVLINTMSDTLLDREGVIEKFQVSPEQIIDYLTLIGDTVDNIPGVQKVGPKTAVKWLQKYGSLQAIIDQHQEIGGKVGENLKNALDDLPLFKSLITIKTDVELDFAPQELKKNKPDNSKLKDYFTQFEFKNWLKDFSDEQPSKPSEYHCVLTEKDFNICLKHLEKCDHFAVDTETTSLNVFDAELVGVSIAVANYACYIPVAHDYEGAPKQLSREFVLDKLKPYLESKDKAKIGHNLKYDMGVLANYDIQILPPIFDTLLESYTTNSVSSRHDMDSLASLYLERQTTTFESVAGKGAKQKTFNQIDLDQAAPYAAEDAEVTLQLHQFFWPTIHDTQGLSYIFEQIEMPLMPVLYSMERNGVLIDAKKLDQQSQELAERLKKLESTAFKIADSSFNLNSPKQLQEILFNQLGLPVIQKTPTGQPSTGEAVLQELARDYDLPQIILEYRSLSKLKSTYTDKLPLQINPKTGRVHTSYHQAVTATGRLSSSDPNLQNIPIRTEMGRKIREAFIAEPGCVLLAADYSQIELRIMAHLSGDKTLQQAFTDGLDIHRATAAEVFGRKLEDVTDEERRNAKAINFGLIYGMSAYGLAEQLGVDRADAESYIDFYFKRFPGVKKYMETTREQARKQGYVETMYGRRLYLPEIKASNFARRSAAERAAINAPMQGAQADIIKKAMVDIDHWLTENAPDVRLIMQVHDELVFEVPEAKVELVAQAVIEKMDGAAELDVPLQVSINHGPNWGVAH